VLSGVKESMKKGVRPVVVAVVLSLCSPSFAQLPRDAAIAKAETILKSLQDGRTGDVVKELDTRMAQALPEEKLKGAWTALIGQFGAYKTINERREGQYQGRQAVELFLAFEKDTIVMRTVFDPEGRISGLVFRPKNLAVLPASK
jgi:Protein of unknown function (DUF3887)